MTLKQIKRKGRQAGWCGHGLSAAQGLWELLGSPERATALDVAELAYKILKKKRPNLADDLALERLEYAAVALLSEEAGERLWPKVRSTGWGPQPFTWCGNDFFYGSQPWAFGNYMEDGLIPHDVVLDRRKLLRKWIRTLKRLA